MGLGVIRSPVTQWHEVKDFPLEAIPKKFDVAEFERLQSQRHVVRIMHAIRNNTFYDNVLRVVKNGKKYSVIDGQHRLKALWRLHTEEGLEKYTLILQIFDANFARRVYQGLNMGKALTIRDHTKALDDGTISFFNDMRDYCHHDPTDKKGTFAELLHALYYAKTGSSKPVNVFNIERILEQITKEDTIFMKQFCGTAIIVSPIRKGSIYYRSPIYRNIFKIGYENSLDSIDMVPLFEKSIENEKIKWRLDKSNQKVVKECYQIILEEVVPNTPVKLCDKIAKQAEAIPP